MESPAVKHSIKQKHHSMDTYYATCRWENNRSSDALVRKMHQLVIKNGVCANSQLSYSTINNSASVYNVEPCASQACKLGIVAGKSFEIYGPALGNIYGKKFGHSTKMKHFMQCCNLFIERSNTHFSYRAVSVLYHTFC